MAVPLFLGGVGGSTKLNAASASDAIPATPYVQAVAAFNFSPVNPEPSTVPSQATSPCAFAARTWSQSTRIKVNGHAARIQPMVPPMRTRPNSFCASFKLAKAMEFTMEIVGTYSRQ